MKVVSCLFIFQAAIAEVGGIKALVDLIFKWSVNDSEGVLVCACRILYMHRSIFICHSCFAINEP